MYATMLDPVSAALVAAGVKTIMDLDFGLDVPCGDCGGLGCTCQGYCESGSNHPDHTCPSCDGAGRIAVPPGERIAVLASEDEPKSRGPWTVEGIGSWGGARIGYDLTGPDGKSTDLALGAVVCTVTVDDALPIDVVLPKTDRAPGDRLRDRPKSERITIHPLSSQPTAYRFDRSNNGHDVADQLPLGDFSPGRWGWVLSNPQPPTKRTWARCSHCLPDCNQPCMDAGWRLVPADPIPCKGRQGVFALPDDIAEALT